MSFIEKLKFNPNLYNLYNIIQKLYCFLPYNLGNGKALPPIRYILNLTTKCNLKCEFCYIGNKSNSKELSTEEWIQIIDQIPPFRVITLTGGEVSLRPDFKDLLKKCAAKSKINLITNAVLLNDELIKMFIDEKIFMLGTSIDGIGENHDRVRGQNGAFNKTVGNIEKIIQTRGNKKFPLVDIKTVILQDNMDEIVEIYKMANKLGVNFHTLSFLKGCDLQFYPILKDEFGEEFYAEKHSVKQYFNMEQFEEVYRELLSLSKRNKTELRIYPEFGLTRGLKELNGIKSFYSKANDMSIKDVYHPCLYPWTEMFILANGDVFPCLGYKTGNAIDTPLKEIWNNDKHKMFRKSLKKAKVFNSCQSCCYSRIAT